MAYRLWGKIMKNNRIAEDHVFEMDANGLSKKDKLTQGIEGLAYHFDIQNPMWFTSNEEDFTQFAKTRFEQQHFIVRGGGSPWMSSLPKDSQELFCLS